MSGSVTSAPVGDHEDLGSALECRTAVADGVHARPNVLVIVGDLLVAEAIVSALIQLTFNARFAMPITAAHVRDLTSWRPGLAILDVDSIDEKTCISIVTLLTEAAIPVAMLGGRLDTPLVGECIDAGATIVIDKASGLGQLVEVISRRLEGRVVLDDEAKRRLLEPIRREAQARRALLAPFEALTHREKCILAELLDGHGPEAIARRSSVSVSTVRSQIKSILQKLGVNSQLAATSLARRSGWTLEEGIRKGRRRAGDELARLEASA